MNEKLREFIYPPLNTEILLILTKFYAIADYKNNSVQQRGHHLNFNP